MAISIPISVSTYPSLVASKRTTVVWLSIWIIFAWISLGCLLLQSAHQTSETKKEFHVHGQSTNVLRIEMYRIYRYQLPLPYRKAKNNGSEFFFLYFNKLIYPNCDWNTIPTELYCHVAKELVHIRERRKATREQYIAFTILIPSAQMKRKELLLNTWNERKKELKGDRNW